MPSRPAPRIVDRRSRRHRRHRRPGLCACGTKSLGSCSRRDELDRHLDQRRRRRPGFATDDPVLRGRPRERVERLQPVRRLVQGRRRHHRIRAAPVDRDVLRRGSRTPGGGVHRRTERCQDVFGGQRRPAGHRRCGPDRREAGHRGRGAPAKRGGWACRDGSGSRRAGQIPRTLPTSSRRSSSARTGRSRGSPVATRSPGRTPRTGARSRSGRWPRRRSAASDRRARSSRTTWRRSPASRAGSSAPMADWRSAGRCRCGSRRDERLMRLAHVRERHAPAGAPWRLAAALDGPPSRWIDLEVARRRALAARPELAHDAVLYRQPITTLDDHLARGLRVAALADIVEAFVPRGEVGDDDALLDGASCVRPPSSTRPRCATLRVRAARRTMWERRGGEIPRPGTGSRSSTSRTCRRCAVRTIRSGRRAARPSSTTRSRSRRSSTRRHGPGGDRAEEAIGGY